MWKLSKSTIFIIFITMTICLTISVILVDWEVVKSKNGIFRELFQPILFLALSMVFMMSYVKKIKK